MIWVSVVSYGLLSVLLGAVWGFWVAGGFRKREKTKVGGKIAPW